MDTAADPVSASCTTSPPTSAGRWLPRSRSGRLAWAGPQGPTVIPVNFVVDRRPRCSVRTAAYSALARECDDSPVAFEVDQFDADDPDRVERADARARPPASTAAPRGDARARRLAGRGARPAR